MDGRQGGGSLFIWFGCIEEISLASGLVVGCPIAFNGSHTKSIEIIEPRTLFAWGGWWVKSFLIVRPLLSGVIGGLGPSKLQLDMK